MTAVAALLLLSLMGTDRLGDPTPPGVMARYGTTRMVVKWSNVGELRFHPTRDEVYVCPHGFQRFPDDKAFIALGWALPSGKECFRYRFTDRRNNLDDLGFDPTGRFRLYTYSGGRVRVWDTREGKSAGEWTPKERVGTVNVVGFDGDRLAMVVFPPNDDADKGVLRVHRLTDGKPTAGEFRIRAGDTAVLSRAGDRVWVVDGSRSEIRSHSTGTGTVTSWRPTPSEPDTDPDPRFGSSSGSPADGTRLVRIAYRKDEKADRYRDRPECFLHLFHAASCRVEARYAFRLDDAGDDSSTAVLGEVPKDGEYGPVHVSDDGRYAAWTDRYERLLIRHLESGRVVVAQGRYHRHLKFAFNPNATRLAVLPHDAIVRLIDPSTGRYQLAEAAPAAPTSRAAISPDGKLVATGHDDGRVWVWDAATGKPLWHTELDGSPVREMHFNPTGTTVSAVGFWGTAGVRTFDAKTGKEMGPMLPCKYSRSAAVSADGKHILDLVERKDGRPNPLFIRTREVATGKEVMRVRLDHHLGMGDESRADVSRDGRMMVVTHTDGDIIAYDTASGKRCGKINRDLLATSISTDGEFVAGWIEATTVGLTQLGVNRGWGVE